MDTLIISMKGLNSQEVVTLEPDAEGMLKFSQGETDYYMSNIDIDSNTILNGFGSNIKNVVIITGGEVVLDESLAADTEMGVFKFKEPDIQHDIETTVTNHQGDNVVVLQFETSKIAKRFVEKKLLGEMLLMNSAEQSSFPVYPLLKEAYLFSSDYIDVGVMGYLNNGDYLDAPTGTIADLTVDPEDQIQMTVDNTGFALNLSTFSKKRISFSSNSGMNLIKHNREQNNVFDGDGNVFWELHNEIFKIYVN